MVGANDPTEPRAGLQRAWPWLYALLLLAFAVVVVFSSNLDWDAFYAFFEVDRRAWLQDHRPPVWSYQLCAGASRSGDPQAFGLSPLFLPVAILGAFWGAKAVVVLCTTFGWLALRRTLCLLFPALGRDLAAALALFFLLGNFFLWHAHAGHVAFSLIPLSFVLVERVVRLAVARFGWRDAAWVAGAGAAILSAGFYPAVVFFLIPATLCLAVPALALGLVRWPGSLALGRFVAGVTVATVLSAHKWLAVLLYQQQFPRTLDQGRHVSEGAIGFAQTLAYQLSPTWQYDFWIAPADWGPWDVWEYSACSAISFLAVALLVRRPRTRLAFRRKTLLFFGVALALCVSFAAHDQSALSLHHLLNRLVYADSVRVIGRYGVVLQLLLLLFVAFRLAADADLRLWARSWLLPAGLVITAINLAMMGANADVQATLAAAAQATTSPPGMRVERIVPLRSVHSPRLAPYRAPTSHMYPAIAAGEIVPNCYQPLRRPRLVSTERTLFGTDAPIGEKLDLVDTSAGPVSEACQRTVTVTQNEIQFDRALCPSDLCLNLNALNPEDPAFAFDSRRRRICLKR
jgi:hypothetical protein